ncbi:uncharacterized protein LOC107267303 [Cephus cinctus]|uniref:Uncharacterized protein LOC107267303 n=1 Tax=Cephus cinctus TaxID=211228 RepID=A0AAJ7BUD1_CEPCN|nr:uncharacterized protein LOC107267303 [Cephus cinctus]
MKLMSLILGLVLITSEILAESQAEDYADVTIAPTSVVTDMENSEDFDRFEIHELDDPLTKNYHCSAKDPHKNGSAVPNPDMIKYLDNNGILSIRPKKNYYQVREVRRKLCQFGFNPFEPDNKAGSIHKRFKNTLRLMLYNTPGMFPGLKVIRNDLDRKRKREPQIWFRFEATNGTLLAEFDYDNYFVTISGDLARVQAYSKLLVALKMHKRLNNFNEPVSYKVNLDLGIMEAILTSFGIWMMREKTVSTLMVNALNGIRTEIGDKGETRLEFEETLKDAADQVDPLLYSYIWLLSMAEKYDVVKIRERSSNGQGKPRNGNYDSAARLKRDHAIDSTSKTH